MFNQITHRRLLEREKWKTQTYEMSFDDIVKRLADMEQQSGGKWHWEQKQEYGPNNNILRSYSFVMREHQAGSDSQSEADVVFQVMVSQWANETNRTRVTEQTTKFGSNRDPDLHQQDLVTETNRIHAVIDAVQGKPWITN